MLIYNTKHKLLLNQLLLYNNINMLLSFCQTFLFSNNYKNNVNDINMLQKDLLFYFPISFNSLNFK